MTREQATEALDLARRRLAVDLDRRLRRRGNVGNGWAPVEFLVDEERRSEPVAAREVRVEGRPAT